VSEKNELGLTEGWKYSVAIDKGPVSDGTFRGYTMLGTESAIVMQMSEGTTRIIPAASIIYIDLIESGERKPTNEKKPESVYYG